MAMSKTSESDVKPSFRRRFLAFTKSVHISIKTKNDKEEMIKQLAILLEDNNASSKNVQEFKELMTTLVKSSKDDKATFKADNLIISGLLAIGLLILQALISLDAHDMSFNVSLLALSISIPTSAGYLFVQFVQEEYNVARSEGFVIKWLYAIALFSGIVGVTAAIWRVFQSASVVFFVISFATFIICAIYFCVIRWQLAIAAEDKEAQSNTTEAKNEARLPDVSERV